MKYLLDTCAISETIRPYPNKSFINWLDTQDENDLYISLLTLGELYKGIFKTIDNKKQQKLLEWVENHLKLRFYGRILSLDDSAIYCWGKINGESEKNGRKIPVIDSLISATANAHQMIIVTRNEKDFLACSAKTFNPWQDK